MKYEKQSTSDGIRIVSCIDNFCDPSHTISTTSRQTPFQRCVQCRVQHYYTESFARMRNRNRNRTMRRFSSAHDPIMRDFFARLNYETKSVTRSLDFPKSCHVNGLKDSTWKRLQRHIPSFEIINCWIMRPSNSVEQFQGQFDDENRSSTHIKPHI
jgi:hypothetical protein